MRNRLVIIGAGGHGKVIADIALKTGYTNIAFADDNAEGFCLSYPIICKISNIESQNDGKTDFIIAVGDNGIRKRIAEQHNINWVTLIHPSAQIGMNVKIGIGTVVMAGAVVNSFASIAEHCIINSCAVIEHENVIENYVHISPNAALGGNVHIGEKTHIGIGATIINNIDICSNCIVGAGAVVVKNIQESSTYIGVPAKMGGVKLNYFFADSSDWRCVA